MKRAIKIAGLFALSLGLPAFAHAQIIEQQSCPSGTTPITAPGTTTINNANGQVLRQWCVDNNGNMYSTGHYHSGTETFANINNTIFLDGVTYTTLAAAYAALPSTGGTIRISPGTFTGSMTLIAGKPVRVIGEGRGVTILIPSVANTPVISSVSTGAVDGNFFSGFSIKAHASGSTGPAIDLSGMRHSTFEDIEYLSNAGANFASFFHFSASPGLCYGNVVIRPHVDTQSGPATVFLFDNGGTSNSANNANQNVIRDMWINTNTGITTIADARRSANTVFEGGLTEGNTGAVVLIPGTATSWNHIWMESNASTSVVGTFGADGASNADIFIGNQISTAQTWTLQSNQQDSLILNNWPDSNLTITDNSGGGTENLTQAGALARSNQNDFCFHLKNTGTNGVDWGLCSATGAGGIGVNGGYALRDFTNLKNALTLTPNTGNLTILGSLTLGSTIGNGTATMGLTLKKGSGLGNYTNATTSYTVADATNLCYTVTIPTGWKLGISASGYLSTATAAVVAQAALTDNAACSTANAGILVETAPIQGAGIGVADGFALNWVITGDGASHNIALQFKTSNAADTASLINSSATVTPTMKFELMPSN